jgi:hypothetical protein
MGVRGPAARVALNTDGPNKKPTEANWGNAPRVGQSYCPDYRRLQVTGVDLGVSSRKQRSQVKGAAIKKPLNRLQRFVNPAALRDARLNQEVFSRRARLARRARPSM